MLNSIVIRIKKNLSASLDFPIPYQSELVIRYICTARYGALNINRTMDTRNHFPKDYSHDLYLLGLFLLDTILCTVYRLPTRQSLSFKPNYKICGLNSKQFHLYTIFKYNFFSFFPNKTPSLTKRAEKPGAIPRGQALTPTKKNLNKLTLFNHVINTFKKTWQVLSTPVFPFLSLYSPSDETLPSLFQMFDGIVEKSQFSISSRSYGLRAWPRGI